MAERVWLCRALCAALRCAVLCCPLGIAAHSSHHCHAAGPQLLPLAQRHIKIAFCRRSTDRERWANEPARWWGRKEWRRQESAGQPQQPVSWPCLNLYSSSVALTDISQHTCDSVSFLAVGTHLRNEREMNATDVMTLSRPPGGSGLKCRDS